MKKIISVISLALCLMLFASCGGAPVVVLPPEVTTEAGTDRFAFEYNGVSFHVSDIIESTDASAQYLRARLGEPLEYSESNSCAYQGLDKVYVYPGFKILSYPDGNTDKVLYISFSDDSVSTPCGIRIGSSEQDVTAAYGDPTDKSESILRYVSGITTLTFKISGGVVSAIEYGSNQADS